LAYDVAHQIWNSKCNRQRQGHQEEFRVNILQGTHPKQRRSLATKPDYMWQYAQRLKKEYAKEGKDIAVYFDAEVSVNQKTFGSIDKPRSGSRSRKMASF
jgi:hypothetical protein